MEIKYDIVYSRRRSVSIIVTPGRDVIVRAPYRASEKTIDSFVREKAAWIRKTIDKYSDVTLLNHNKTYTDGEIHLFLGQEYRLKLIKSTYKYVNQYDNTFEVGYTGNVEGVKPVLDRWYRQKAEEYISAKFKEILDNYRDYNFKPLKLVIRPLRSRWGSCTSQGKITISSELIKIDERFIEYVITHELCHLKYHNHGKDYYNLLKTLVPDYKTIRRELKSFITK
jgi:predicted metal-dependent hydrolase